MPFVAMGTDGSSLTAATVSELPIVGAAFPSPYSPYEATRLDWTNPFARRKLASPANTAKRGSAAFPRNTSHTPMPATIIVAT